MNHPLASDKESSTQAAISTLAALALAYFLWERSQTKKELIEEHESLIQILRRGRKKELKREAKKQAKELAEYKKNPKRRKNAAFMKEDFRGFTTKKLQELESSGGYNADTGLEVDPDALHEELMRRYEKQGEKSLKKYTSKARAPKDIGPLISRKNKALKSALRDLKRLDKAEWKLWTEQPQFEAMPNPEVVRAIKSIIKALKAGRKPRKASIRPCKGGKSFRPPVRAAKEAREGLRLRREYHRGGTKVGIARARDIANRKCLPVKTVKRMKSYFARHKHDKLKQKKPPSNGRIAWKLWGGNAGKSWTSKVLKKYE